MATKVNILIPLTNKSGKKVFLEETTYEFCPELWNIIKDYLFGNQNDKLLFWFKATSFYETLTISDLVGSYKCDVSDKEAEALENAYFRRLNNKITKITKFEAFESLYKMKRWRVIIDRKIIQHRNIYRNTYYVEKKRCNSVTGKEKTSIFLRNDEYNFIKYIASKNDMNNESLCVVIRECMNYKKESEKIMNIIKSV